MAKSFITPGRNVPTKPLSERDFFDLTEEVSPPPGAALAVGAELLRPAAATESSEVIGNTDNTDNTRNAVITDKPGNREVIGNSKPKKKRSAAATAGNTDNSVNAGVSGNGSITCNTAASTSPVAPVPVSEKGDVRQTFIMGRAYLEKLRNYVHARRAKGDYAYSQKQALQEALDFLFLHEGLAGPRPDEAREREQQHRERIKEGRQTRAAKGLPHSPTGGS